METGKIELSKSDLVNTGTIKLHHPTETAVTTVTTIIITPPSIVEQEEWDAWKMAKKLGIIHDG